MILSRSGSYVLSSNLTAPANKDGIVVGANYVTIDLNGFKITGNGSVEGITDNNVNRRGTAVRNGSIANFLIGILLRFSTDNDIEQIRARNNINAGIVAGARSIVNGNIASENGGSGIVVGVNSLVSGNNASQNAEDGIAVDCPSNIVGNIALENTDDDIAEGIGGCTRANNNPAP